MIGHGCGILQRAAILQVRGNARGSKGVIANRRLDPNS
jgi:hypothetical protein